MADSAQTGVATFSAINEPTSGGHGGSGETQKISERRRGSLERYRPGAYYNEEREKHRRRGHFGENRIQKDEESGRPTSNGGGSEGNGEITGNERRGNRNRNRNRGNRKNKSEEAKPEPKPESKPKTEENGVGLQEMEEPKRRLWADDSFEDPIPEPIKEPRSHQISSGDLRNKLNEKRRQNGPNGQNHQNGDRKGHKNKSHLPRPKKNTENFNPSYEPPQMRILCAPPGMTHYSRPYGSRDVAVVTDLFVEDIDDLTIYNQLLEEIQGSGVDEELLWQKWHGDSRLIADDKRNWKRQCPTFSWVVEKLADYFQMDVQATRLNWYQNSSDWKPFHHDAAAMKPDKARTQNMTVGVSFGAERDAAFEHAQTKTVISMPQPNGTIYTFGRDVNILWRHGIPQLPPDQFKDVGRISIICWGWVDQFDM